MRAALFAFPNENKHSHRGSWGKQRLPKLRNFSHRPCSAIALTQPPKCQRPAVAVGSQSFPLPEVREGRRKRQGPSVPPPRSAAAAVATRDTCDSQALMHLREGSLPDNFLHRLLGFSSTLPKASQSLFSLKNQSVTTPPRGGRGCPLWDAKGKLTTNRKRVTLIDFS